MATAQTETDEQGITRCPVRHDYQPYSPHGLNFPDDEIRPMRNETPVFFCPQTQMWIITRHADILAATKDTKRFSSNAFRQVPLPPEAADWFPEGVPVSYPGLINNDPPAHTRIRKLCNKAFTRPIIAAMREPIEEQTKDLLDPIIPRGECELISEFSALLPATMFCDILGLPRAEVGQILRWGDAMMMSVGTLRPPEDQILGLYEDIVKFNELIVEIAADRRANPRGDKDFMTNLVLAKDGDEPPLTDLELKSVFGIFMVAGHETTRHLIGNSINLLLQNPDQLQEVIDNPELVENVVEETLRHTGSTRGFFRRATEDIEIDGVTIPEGDIIQLMFSSANHDESVWEDDARYDIHRKDANKHMAFGIGTHFCIGAPLARLQGQIAIRELLQRMPNLRYKHGEPPVDRIPSLSVNGLQRLEIEWDA